MESSRGQRFLSVLFLFTVASPMLRKVYGLQEVFYKLFARFLLKYLKFDLIPEIMALLSLSTVDP